MRLKFGPLQVKIKYSYPRGKTTVYQRAVPSDLRDRYPSPTVKQVLQTSDPVKVTKMVDALNRRYEAEWAGLRAAPESSPQALQVQADALLKEWGLKPHAPDNDARAVDLLIDHLEGKAPAYSVGDSHERQPDPSTYLSPVESEAWRRLATTRNVTIKDALGVYLDTNRKSHKESFRTYTSRAFDTLLKVTGNKDLAAFTRADAHDYIAKALESGLKTKTVRRRVNAFRAIWAAYCREKSITLPNPFERIAIRGEGNDSESRTPYSDAEVKNLYTACRKQDDPRRWIIAMIIDTGARLAEIVGLTLNDIHLDAPVPYIALLRHPWRDLKGEKLRNIPLVGAALWAAQRVKSSATEGQRFAFPQYTSDEKCNANSASAALCKWIQKSVALDHDMHELRHTLKDRLREVQCPKSINDSIHGHTTRDVGDDYGEGYSLKVKHEWLTKAALLAD